MRGGTAVCVCGRRCRSSAGRYGCRRRFCFFVTGCVTIFRTERVLLRSWLCFIAVPAAVIHRLSHVAFATGAARKQRICALVLAEVETCPAILANQFEKFVAFLVGAGAEAQILRVAFTALAVGIKDFLLARDFAEQVFLVGGLNLNSQSAIAKSDDRFHSTDCPLRKDANSMGTWQIERHVPVRPAGKLRVEVGVAWKAIVFVGNHPLDGMVNTRVASGLAITITPRLGTR